MAYESGHLKGNMNKIQIWALQWCIKDRDRRRVDEQTFLMRNLDILTRNIMFAINPQIAQAFDDNTNEPDEEEVGLPLEVGDFDDIDGLLRSLKSGKSVNAANFEWQ